MRGSLHFGKEQEFEMLKNLFCALYEGEYYCEAREELWNMCVLANDGVPEAWWKSST